MSSFGYQKDEGVKDRRYIVVVLRLIIFAILYVIAFQEHNVRDLPWLLWLILGLFLLSEAACLFEPFFTTKEKGKGTGLGLATVYGIIKQHEGWINISSEPSPESRHSGTNSGGKGTLVRICLPALKCRKKEKPETRLVSPDMLRGNGELILVVEDQKEMLDFVSLALKKNGYTVFGAANAQEALDIFDREKGNIGLVFSDVVLPGQTGIELVNKIVSLKPDQKVILTSGYMDEKSQWPIISQKGYRFLQKPYPINLLLVAVKEAISPQL